MGQNNNIYLNLNDFDIENDSTSSLLEIFGSLYFKKRSCLLCDNFFFY